MTVRDLAAINVMDHRFADGTVERARPALRRPRAGWIKAVRRALGMSARQLGERSHVSGSAISQAERSELEGTISLGKLQDLADAMGCDLVYGFVPRTSLEASVRDQAHRRARQILSETNQHMALEDQRVSDEGLDRLVERLAADFLWRRNLWDEPPGSGDRS
jgi:predicted DNA-binding mobile mystery protein A